MTAPALGSRVTVLAPGGGILLGEVRRHADPAVFDWSVPGYGGASGGLRVADENIRWCRGWHSGDSDEVKAMKVARALGPELAMDLEKAQRAYLHGEMTREAWLANLDRWDADFEEGRR